ncbi:MULTISPECIES: Bax inhibitor-1/YccA family protein [unclassified Gilliamella]|uniref:Bax inhibitor-1/YccA family protein n=1 Tax=unclassified Gilliamella TaxID=2685620 RepID=UPI00226ADDA6|nr:MULTISPECIES: Bax inhibitor-1/YccA family protein [unclassified Gilliamella]MCX8573891.1 Bax inhibitor-1/YccA family protein [Gilliamella sp. B3831]MCX8576122.1 Bax inhibitor-1/YccA family protein [Gilliamella sp. B3815]MCX8588039.1 Bax inhibitor-1/YccA family protein [Gilliamella sp. B3801]MCX8593147.1 Bax inhibitor-1/YccA family protein [Gilliamella sp. B3804]MCX8603223.1 Bax inhibitor-1/YccA family protein [Gilliamella sp. B3823]
MAGYTPNGSIIEQSGSRVQTYMSHVYGWMTVGLLLTAMIAWFASTNVQLMRVLYNIMWVLLIAELGLVFVISGLINRLSGAAATTLFMLYSVLNGCTFSIYFLVYTSSSIASVFFITAGMFGALAFYGYTTKRDLSGFGRFLFMGLVGIIIASIVNIFLQSEPLMWAVTYIGVFVFAGLTAYDTQKLKELGENISQDDPNMFRRYVILGALTLYLDFINLFILLLRIFADRR